MAENDSVSPFDAFTGTRHWRVWALVAATLLVAAVGTWIAGQYKIGRLDSMRSRYSEPVTDFAHAFSRAKTGSMESDLLESCKQAQIGTWLQTTDAIAFESPITGNRVQVRLDPSKAFLDLNGREMSGCISDEIENRQFDIGSMTNTWALVLFLLSLGVGAWSWFGWESWRRRNKPAAVTPVSSDAVIEPEKSIEL